MQLKMKIKKPVYRRRPNKTNFDRTGATAVEFAFVFPIILVFFIGIIAVTQAFFIRDLTQLAAYESARKGTVLDSTSADIQSKAQQVLATMGLKNAVVTIKPSNITNSTKDVEVTVSVPIHENSWVSGPFLPAKWTVVQSVKLKKTDDR